jgi:hypothetical protein
MFLLTINSVKRTDANELAVGDLELFVVHLTMLKEGYERVLLNVPEWLETSLKRANEVLNFRLRDDKERKLKNLKNRLEALKTPDERRKDIAAEIAALEKELA